MLMRVIVVCVSVLALFPVGTALAEETPFVPVFTGGKIQTELNLTDRDLLPMLQAFITTIPAGHSQSEMIVGQMPVGILDVCRAFAAVRRLSVVTYDVPAGTESGVIADFYMQKLGLTKGWASTIRVEQLDHTFRLYTQPDMEGLLAIDIKQNRVSVVRTEGKIDVAALSRALMWFAPSTPVEGEHAPADPEDSQSEPVPGSE